VDVVDIGGALLITAFLVWNQMRSRPIVAQRMALIPVLLVILGLIQPGSVVPRTALGVGLLVLGLALALGFGVARGRVAKVWVGPGDQFWRRGTSWLLALWVASILVKVGLDLGGSQMGAPIPGGDLFVELGVTLAAQNAVLLMRSVGFESLLGSAQSRRSTP
jgi:hypothetical protein